GREGSAAGESGGRGHEADGDQEAHAAGEAGGQSSAEGAVRAKGEERRARTAQGTNGAGDGGRGAPGAATANVGSERRPRVAARAFWALRCSSPAPFAPCAVRRRRRSPSALTVG